MPALDRARTRFGALQHGGADHVETSGPANDDSDYGNVGNVGNVGNDGSEDAGAPERHDRPRRRALDAPLRRLRGLSASLDDIIDQLASPQGKPLVESTKLDLLKAGVRFDRAICRGLVWEIADTFDGLVGRMLEGSFLLPKETVAALPAAMAFAHAADDDGMVSKARVAILAQRRWRCFSTSTSTSTTACVRCPRSGQRPSTGGCQTT